MAAPFDPTDPSNLTPEQRLDELSRLLAIGVERALSSSASSRFRGAPPPPPEFVGNQLDVLPDIRHMTNVVNTQGESAAGVER